jgi:hypothetical protein
MGEAMDHNQQAAVERRTRKLERQRHRARRQRIKAERALRQPTPRPWLTEIRDVKQWEWP